MSETAQKENLTGEEKTTEVLLHRRTTLKSLGALGVGSALSSPARASSGSVELIAGTVQHRDVPNLHPRFASNTLTGRLLIHSIYDKGYEFHPDTMRPVSWGYERFKVDEREKTVTVKLRDDLEFNDGTQVTPEDVKTTVQFLNRFSPIGGIPVDRVETTTRGRAIIHYEELYPPERILKFPIVPSHIWQSLLDNNDAKDYRPVENGGPVGSGPFQLVKANFDVEDKPYDQEFELEQRPSHPIAADTPFLDKGAPFADRVTIRTYPGGGRLLKAMKKRDVDLGFDLPDVTVGKFDSDAEVHTGAGQGWQHISHNLRRTPLDDKPFRQALAMVFDHDMVEEELYESNTAGDLAMPDSYEFYRPFDRDNPRVEQFSRPESDGDSIDVSAIREFLVGADGQHNYSFGPVESDLVTGDKEIRINGKLLPEAHTDNDGNPGQGPLVFQRNSDKFSEGLHPAWEQWITELQKVGIPIESKIVSFNQQLHNVFRDEDFDSFEMGWENIPPGGSYLNPLFHSDGIDGGTLRGDDDDSSVTRDAFNPMGYSAADDEIDEVWETLNPYKRLFKIRNATMKIYEDQPSLVVSYNRTVEALSSDWTGWLPGYNRFSGQLPLMNVRPD